MNKTQALAELKRMGTAQNRKVYARHGVGSKQFGVSYANLGKLRKKVRVDQPLAEGFWKSGVHDARVFAAMVADPDAISAGVLDAWVKDLDNYVVTDAFAGFAARTRFAPGRVARWTRSRNEWISTAGWNVVAHLALRDDGLDAADLEELLDKIEAGIGSAKNRTRYAMNSALIAIGMRNAKLRRLATAAAKRIGPVEVDHGETGCKTPEAVSYLAKVWSRRKK